MCGGGSPPPPPDYTKQKADIRRATEARYQQQADAYNQSVQEYNQNLQELASQGASLVPTANNLSITNPGGGSFSSSLNDLQSSLATTTFNEPRPTFSSTVGSEYGTVGISNIPTLRQPNTQLYNTLQNQVSSAQQRLQQVRSERAAEERRRNSFRNELMGDLSGLQSSVGNLTIADADRINQIDSQLSSLRSRAQSFSSPLGGISGLDFSSVADPLSDLRQRRQEELNRIQGFEQSLLDTADELRPAIEDLTIADLDQLQSYEDQIEDARRRAARFSSQLDFDFSDELGPYGLGEPASLVDDLLSERRAEQQRIEQAERDYRQRARGLSDLASNMSIYDAANIDQVARQLDTLEGDVSGFSSLLPFDFSSVQNEALPSAETSLEALRNERQSALDEILSGISGATSGLSDIELANEDAFNERRTQLSDLQRELGLFSGGRVGDIETQLTSGLDAVDSRLAELQARRAEIETRAQELQQQVQDAQYRRLNDLSGDSSSVEDLQAEIELYNAQQALDELQAIEERLQGERVRLEQDAENVAARQRQAQESLLSNVDGSGVPQFRNFALADPTTAEAYEELLARVQNGEDEEEALLRQAAPGSFSRNIGVVRV